MGPAFGKNPWKTRSEFIAECCRRRNAKRRKHNLQLVHPDRLNRTSNLRIIVAVAYNWTFSWMAVLDTWRWICLNGCRLKHLGKLLWQQESHVHDESINQFYWMELKKKAKKNVVAGSIKRGPLIDSCETTTYRRFANTQLQLFGLLKQGVRRALVKTSNS